MSIPERWKKFGELAPNIDQKLTQLIPLLEKELITSGQTSFDISPFKLERFEEGEVVGEKRVV